MRLTGCNKQYFLFISANEKATAEALASEVFADGAEEHFTVGLSASGQLPATHYALGIWANDDLVEIFSAELGKGVLQTIKFFRLGDDGILQSTNVVPGSIGQPWSYQQSLEALDLQLIVTEAD